MARRYDKRGWKHLYNLVYDMLAAGVSLRCDDLASWSIYGRSIPCMIDERRKYLRYDTNNDSYEL